MFEGVLEGLIELLPHLEELRGALDKEANLRASRVIHNLKTLNAHSMQELFFLIPQDLISTGSYAEQVENVKKLVVKDPTKTATALLKLNKLNIATRCEFNSFTKLLDQDARADKKVHSIRRVVLNTLHIFFPDFTDKHVYVDVAPNSDMVKLDYESFQVALFHLVDNATKYVMDHSLVNVTFSMVQGFHVTSFDMTSLAISDSDYNRMFDDGFSSDVARKQNLSGDGLGMGIVQNMVEFNGGRIEVRRNVAPNKKIIADSLVYERNQFNILLPM